MEFGTMLEAYFKGLILFGIMLIIITAILVWGTTYCIMKTDDGGAAQKKYEETVNSLTEEQRKILGL